MNKFFLRPDTYLGQHYVAITPFGDEDDCVDFWDDNGTTQTSTGNCTEFDFTFQTSGPGKYKCVALDIVLSNDCVPRGISRKVFICPDNRLCEKSANYELQVSPNPMKGHEIFAEILPLSDDVEDNEIFPSTDFIILDRDGNIVYRFGANQHRTVVSLPNLENGVYTIHTTVDQEMIATQFIISR